MKIFHSEDQTLFNCKICAFQTIYPRYVKKHVEMVHQKIENLMPKDLRPTHQPFNSVDFDQPYNELVEESPQKKS